MHVAVMASCSPVRRLGLHAAAAPLVAALLVAALLLPLGATPTLAQTPSGGAMPGSPAASDSTATRRERAWTPIVTRGGLAVSHIFYPDAQGREAGGVVLRLANTNAHAVRYAFTVVFRAGEGTERTARVRGRLAAGQRRTGSHDGLFWTPFAADARRSLGEVGLRGLRVRRAPGGG